jgi:hypothetical protein
VIPVSAVTGEGIDTLRLALAAACAQVPARGSDEPWRLPVDRVFSVAGAGTVVTGTGWSGVLERESAVRILPSGATARVRGLESHGARVEVIQAGHRVAVALAGIDREEIPVGATLVRADDPWETTQVIRADLTTLADAPRLGPRTRLRFHLGTMECGARVIASGGEMLPGATRAAFDLGARYGYDESERGTTEIESQIIELDAGLLFAFADPGTLVQPYVGAGLALVFVDNETTVDTDTTREREAALGRYLRTGLAVEFRPAQLVGLELRYLDGDDVRLGGRDISLEAYTVALTFGARF